MKKTILAFIISFVSVCFQAKSQSISISSFNPAQCAGNRIKVIFRSEGIAANNPLHLEITRYNQNNYKNLETQRSGDTLITVLPPDINIYYPKNDYSNYQLRIASESPRVVSDAVYISVYDKIKLTFSGEITADPFQNVNLNPTEYGSPPYTVTFSNGLTLTIPYFDTFIVSPGKETTYTPVSVTNACGTGTVSGSKTVKIQPVDLRISSTTLPRKFCKGSAFYVNIIKSASFNKDNQYTVQCKSYNGTYQNCITTMENDSLLKAIVPTETTIEQIGYLRVVANSPEVFGKELLIHSEITDHFIENVSSIKPYGNDYTMISLKGQTVGKSIFRFSNGEIYTSDSDGYPSSIGLLPTNETKTYTLISAEDACGAIPVNPGGNSVTVEKVPFVAIQFTVRQVAFCRGAKDPLTFPVYFEQDVSDDGNFQVEFSKYGDTPYTYPARLSADKKSVIVNFPEDFYNYYAGNPYITYYDARILNRNLNIVSNKIQLNANTPPTAGAYGDATIKTRETAFVHTTYSGGGPYRIELNDGSKASFIDGYNTDVAVSPVKTTDYFVKSITNACGNGTPQPSISTIRVSSPSDFNIQLAQPGQSSICVGNSMDVSFETIGNVPPGTRYKVELFNRFSNELPPVTIGTGTGSPIRITIPADVTPFKAFDVARFFKYIRVMTEDGTVISNDQALSVKRKPFFTMDNAGYKTGAATHEQSITVYLHGGDPFYYSFNNEPEKLVFSGDYLLSNISQQGAAVSYNTNFQKAGEYKVTSLRNECGTSESFGNGIKIVPFTLQINDISALNQCREGVYPLFYNILGLNENVTLKAQMAKDRNGDFGDLEIVKQGNPLWIKYPAGMAEGSYYVRLKAQQYDIVSDPIYINLAARATGTMTTRDGQTVGLISPYDNSFECIMIKTNTNNTPWEAWVDNLDRSLSSSYSSQCFSVTPKEPTTYTLKKIINVCGFTDATSSVKIDFKPSVKILSSDYIQTCAGNEIAYSFESRGSFSERNEFIVTITSNGTVRTSIEVLRTKERSFNGKIKIPADLKDGYYSLEFNSSSDPSIRTFSSLSISSKPTAEIIDGSTTVNPGSDIIIPLKATGMDNGGVLIFTDGSTYKLSSGYFYISNLTRTTTFELKSVSNGCGVSPAKGKFTVYLNPESTKKISTNIYIPTGIVCKGERALLNVVTTGISGSPKFQAQLSDATGGNFKDVLTENGPYSGTFYATIPQNIPGGVNYRIRLVIPDDKEAQSAASREPLIIRDNATLTLTLQKSYFTGNTPGEVKFDLTGDAPWTVTYGDTLGRNTANLTITTNPYILKIYPTNTTYYKIHNVRDPYCQTGIIKGPNPFRIETLTATENVAVPIIVYPNPTQEKLRIESETAISKVSVTDMSGKLIRTFSKDLEHGIIDLSELPSAAYLIEVFTLNQSYKYKIIKL